MMIDVLSGQVNLTQAENNLLEGKYQIMIMKNNLETALGSTLDNYFANTQDFYYQ